MSKQVDPYVAIRGYIEKPDELKSRTPWVSWEPLDLTITLDGSFTAEELEAFAAFMREHSQS